ncbi:MAG: hypothetical protein WCF04_06375 [Candidatus Nanopelagicales bacterium]
MFGFPRRASVTAPSAPTQVQGAPGDAGRPTEALEWAAVLRLPRSGSGEPARTQVLAAPVVADVDASSATQVLSREPAGQTSEPAGPPTREVASRQVAAEIGMYAGAGLAMLAIATVGVRGWPQWNVAARGASVGMLAVALLAAGLYVRLPRAREITAQRRRAVSTMLTSGVAVAVVAATTAVGSGVAGSVRVGIPGGPGGVSAWAAAIAALSALGAILVNLVARTPFSESALLAALAWAIWLLVPAGPAAWACLLGVGVVWALVGMRLACGHRSAAVAGVSLALAASVSLAGGPWGWPARALLAAAAIGGLAAFLRGRANSWLAMGAAAAAALAGTVAGDVLGPAVALLLGGLATMSVSWIALRGASRQLRGGAAPPHPTGDGLGGQW